MPLTDEELFNNFRNLEYIQDNWLHHFSEEYKNGSVNPVVKQMTDKLKYMVQARQCREAWKIYDKLDELVRVHGTSDEIGDVEVIRAWTESEIGRLTKAYNLLFEANKRYLSDEHDCAVTVWMMGIVLWRSNEECSWEAIERWEDCRKSFEGLRSNNRLGQTRSDWYKYRCEEIGRFLKIVQDTHPLMASSAQPDYQPRPAGDQTDVNPEDIQPEPPTKPTPQPSESTTPQTTDQAVPVPTNRPKGRVPSGPAGWLRVYATLQGQVNAGELMVVKSSSAGFIDVTEVKIGNVAYLVESLDSYDNLINLVGEKRPNVIQVTGDSMNAYPIENGDYIIVKQVEINPFKDKSLSGKIVLASTYEVDGKEQINIKILRYFGNAPHLEYMSESKEHKEGYQNKTIPFKKGWKIIGVVVARLTPKLEENET